MFYYSLVQLVQDVGGDRLENMDVEEVFPEWMYDRLDANFLASVRVGAWPIIDEGESFENGQKSPDRKGLVFTELVLWNRTHRAMFSAGD